MIHKLLRWWRNRRRRRLCAAPLPAGWDALFSRVPHYRLLSPDERARLRDKARILIAEKHWEACAGLAMSDEIRVTIAAQAALLILELDQDYASLQSILVYPRAFVNPLPSVDATGVVTHGQAMHGEAWQRGPVVLDWDETRSGVADATDGRNLVLHEFAHKLDMLDGFADGCPPLHHRTDYRRWQTVMTREYDALRSSSALGRATLLDDYGTANPAEFFAVATECFFEQGGRLRTCHPELYAVLADYYRQDPAARAVS